MKALIIDDERSVHSVVSRMLTRSGIECLVAATATAGISEFTTHHKEIGVVLLDLTLPDLSGEEVFNAITAIDPDAKIVVMSGHNVEHLPEGMKGNILSYIQKPVRLADIKSIVTSIIG